MDIAPLAHPQGTGSPLESMRSELLAFAQELTERHLLLSKHDVVRALEDIEDLSKIIDHLQIVAARAVQDHGVAGTGEQEASDSLLVRAQQSLSTVQDDVSGGACGSRSAGAEQRNNDRFLPEFKTCADFLRGRLGISHSEANRRLRLAASLLPETTAFGSATPAPMSALGAAASAGVVSGRAVSIIHDAVQRVRSFATPVQLDSMEHHLTRQAVESDEDLLRVLARRWEGVLNQDGQEPTEKVLKARQGVFLRGRRNGLHFLEIGATDEQFEHLVTVMNTATNPRAKAATLQNNEDPAGDRDRADGMNGENETGDAGGCSTGGRQSERDDADVADVSAGDTDRPTRPQSLLDGLVAACRIALSTDRLPAAGGHRPQVMVTISYSDLVGEMGRAGHAVFGQQMSARCIRRLACDADIIPMVLGGQGQILDLGRAQRLFPAHLRRGLVARDKGCAFPDCSIPAPWCEAHHITPWAKGGTTSISQGVLLCSRHHHVIHEGDWNVESKHGIPWFSPPGYLDPDRSPRRNTYWQVEEAVHEQLRNAERGRSAASAPLLYSPTAAPATPAAVVVL
ncbi:HNH endonuclease signature motif containing protein [Arthrobacter agilis]|uniref:HNH endonuclease signature motif containing protein n=1 Tax=Arthrobacter agilis TaxID=37921 RepID=UPI002789003E|nr:HNH endonuclease signature motif containing protein [Arthrobacter agilis]MDQ0733765.1 hypothetical protein [Arthrobacter agilis]